MEKNLFFNSTGLCKSTRMLVPFSLSSEKWLGPSTGSATFLHWPLKIKTDYLVDYQVINVHMYTHLLVTKLGICYVTCPWNTYYFEIHLIYTAYILVALFELNLATAVHDIKLKVCFSLSTAFFSFLSFVSDIYTAKINAQFFRPKLSQI